MPAQPICYRHLFKITSNFWRCRATFSAAERKLDVEWFLDGSFHTWSFLWNGHLRVLFTILGQFKGKRLAPAVKPNEARCKSFMFSRADRGMNILTKKTLSSNVVWIISLTVNCKLITSPEAQKASPIHLPKHSLGKCLKQIFDTRVGKKSLRNWLN